MSDGQWRYDSAAEDPVIAACECVDQGRARRARTRGRGRESSLRGVRPPELSRACTYSLHTAESPGSSIQQTPEAEASYMPAGRGLGLTDTPTSRYAAWKKASRACVNRPHAVARLWSSLVARVMEAWDMELGVGNRGFLVCREHIARAQPDPDLLDARWSPRNCERLSPAERLHSRLGGSAPRPGVAGWGRAAWSG